MCLVLYCDYFLCIVFLPFGFFPLIDAGTNCCYMEDTARIPGNMQETKGLMCINTEWGAFGNNGELSEELTEFDVLVDKESMDQGKCK